MKASAQPMSHLKDMEIALARIDAAAAVAQSCVIDKEVGLLLRQIREAHDQVMGNLVLLKRKIREL